MIPEKLNDFKVYANDNPSLAGVSDIQLPSLNFLSDTVTGSGILGEYNAPNFLQTESMQLTINWRMITDNISEFLKPESIKLDCRLANQEYDPVSSKHSFVANRLVVRGNVTGNDLGRATKGSGYEGSSTVEVLYFKLERNGSTLIEIDKINYVFVVDGTDYTAQLREALGM